MDRYVDSKGTRIYYQIKGTGQPLVLLMGFGADGNTWEKHLVEFQTDFTCVIIDNRGVGRSDQPAGLYTTKLMAEDTLAVMEDAGIEKAHVAGISMGGAIAQELVLQNPDRIISLVLVSTWSAFNVYTRKVYENLKKIRAFCPPDVFMELLQLWIYAPPYYELKYNDLKKGQHSAANNTTPQTKQGFEGQLDACILHDTSDRLSEITVPTLITVGALDIFTPPSYSEFLHKNIKKSKYLIFPHGGHVHHWEDLAGFNEAVKRFLLEHR